MADLLADVNLTIIDQHAREMWDIDAVLARTTDDGYAICIDCGNAIAYGRLQAYPTATRCYRCQVRHEKSYLQPRHPAL